MSLAVLSVAYPLAPVGDAAVGGAEVILSALDRALVEHGHRSIVVACEGSRPCGTLLFTALPLGLITEEIRARVTQDHQTKIDRALASATVDLIHMHGIDFHAYRLPDNVPVLVTLHMPPSWYPEKIWRSTSHQAQLQCVSRSQRDACPPDSRSLPVIENGVDLPSPTSIGKRNFALALGRVCPEKNLHVALDAGAIVRMPVLIGGEVFPYGEHVEYFHQQIEPRLRGGSRFLGPLPPARKQRLLSAAKCLLLPTLAPETSSLVAMEALAAGTPVIAFPSGAIPEIIKDGVTGFLVNGTEEMAAAIIRVNEIDPERCRRAARERFSAARMTAEYLELYSTLIGRHSAAGVCAA